MLKVWNVSLVLATGVLAILGTFLVRSGILESIHAFGASTLGIPFLVLIVRDDRRLDRARARAARSRCAPSTGSTRCCRARPRSCSTTSCSSSLCFVVFWGTFFPLISEALTGEEASVGPPWFNRYITPLALILVLLSGIGPLIAWRRATAANLRRNFALPVGAARRSCSRCWSPRASPSSVPALLMFAFAAFVLGAVGQELWRGVRARRAMSRDSVPGGARRARAAQPAALRRLHRARRASRCCSSASRRRRRSRTQRLVELRPGQTERVGDTRSRYERPTSEARRGRERAARADRPRRATCGCASGDGGGAAARHLQVVLPHHGSQPRPGLALLRGGGDVGGRAAGRRPARLLDRRRARHRRGCAPIDRRAATRCSADLPRTSSSTRLLGRGARGLADALRRGPAAGDVPLHRLAARELDLARRADRLRRRRRSRCGPRAPRARRPATAAGLARVARELERA